MYLLIFGFLLGTILGSFAKALADRSLKNFTFLGRSFCPKCKHKLGLLDLVPIISYLALRGKCRYCRKQISVEYLLIEALFGFIMAAVFWQFGQGSMTDLVFKVFFVTVLGILFLTDIKDMFIPDRIVIPSIVIAFFWLAAFSPQIFVPSVLTGLGIGLFFLFLVVVTKGRGMGGGDIKLGAFIGLCLGPLGLVALMLSFLTGAVIAIFLVIFGKKHFGQVIPFGPFLVLGSLITMFWGDQILSWYLNLS